MRVFTVTTVPTERYTEYHVHDADGSSVYVSLYERHAHEHADKLNSEYIRTQFLALKADEAGR